MGIHLSTEAIVISIYGGTKWTNISDKFLIGASSTGGTSSITSVPSHSHPFKPNGSISGGSYTFNGTNKSYTSGNQSQDHGHTFKTDKDGGHLHPLYSDTIGYEVGGYAVAATSGNNVTALIHKQYQNINMYATSTNDTLHQHSGTTWGVNANHTHTTSITPAGSISVSANPSFSGSNGTTSSTGDSSVSVLNPYYAVYIWIRTA